MVISLDIVSSSVACFLVFVSLTAAKYGIREIIRRTWIIFLGSAASAVSVLLYGQVSGQVYAHWGIITVSQGSVMLALATALRIIAIGVPAIALISGIDPTGLASSTVGWQGCVCSQLFQTTGLPCPYRAGHAGSAGNPEQQILYPKVLPSWSFPYGGQHPCQLQCRRADSAGIAKGPIGG